MAEFRDPVPALSVVQDGIRTTAGLNHAKSARQDGTRAARGPRSARHALQETIRMRPVQQRASTARPGLRRQALVLRVARNHDGDSDSAEGAVQHSGKGLIVFSCHNGYVRG